MVSKVCACAWGVCVHVVYVYVHGFMCVHGVYVCVCVYMGVCVCVHGVVIEVWGGRLTLARLST